MYIQHTFATRSTNTGRVSLLYLNLYFKRTSSLSTATCHSTPVHSNALTKPVAYHVYYYYLLIFPLLRVAFRLFMPDFPQRRIRCSRNLNHSQCYRLTCNIAVLQHKQSHYRLGWAGWADCSTTCLSPRRPCFLRHARKHVFGYWLLTDGLSFVARCMLTADCRTHSSYN